MDCQMPFLDRKPLHPIRFGCVAVLGVEVALHVDQVQHRVGVVVAVLEPLLCLLCKLRWGLGQSSQPMVAQAEMHRPQMGLQVVEVVEVAV
jgi:hypothetical protein